MMQAAESPLNFAHTDFDWVRGYLQREEERTSPPAADVHDTSDSGCSTVDEGISQVAKRKKAEPAWSTLGSTSLLQPQVVRERTEDSELTFVSEASSMVEEEDSGEKKRRKVSWTSTEDLAILASVRALGTQWERVAAQLPLAVQQFNSNWERMGPTKQDELCRRIAAQLPGRTPDAVRNRYHRLQKTHSLSDTDEGRAALDALLLACGVSKEWEPVETLTDRPPPRKNESQKACIKGSDHGRSMWSKHEDALIEEGVRRFGCKWRLIAASLPGRSDSSTRNRWVRLQKEHAHLREIGVASGASVASVSAPRPSPAPMATAVVVPSLPAASAQSAAPVIPPLVASTSQLPPPPSELPTISELQPSLSASERPPAFTGLKRRASSKRDLYSAMHSPLGFGSPLLGFDLECFVEAVSGAIDEETGNVYNEELFEVAVDEMSSAALGTSNAAAQMRVPKPKELKEELAVPPTCRAPDCLLLLSGVLSGMAACTIGATLVRSIAAR